MSDAIEQVLREFAHDGNDDPSLGWEVYANSYGIIRVTATTKATYGQEIEAFRHATKLSNRLAQVEGVRPSEDVGEILSAVSAPGNPPPWQGKIEVVLVRD